MTLKASRLEDRVRRVPGKPGWDRRAAIAHVWPWLPSLYEPAGSAVSQITSDGVPNNVTLFPPNGPFPNGPHMSPGSCPLPLRYKPGRYGMARESGAAAGRAGGKPCIADSHTKISSHVSTGLRIIPETTPPCPNPNKNLQNLILWDSNHSAFIEK